METKEEVERAVPAEKLVCGEESFKIPGTRKWTQSRIQALLDRACESGVRGVDGSPESLANQRFVKSANAWLGATTGMESGVRARLVPMCGPKPPCNFDSRQPRFVDWDLPKDCTLSFSEKGKDAGLEFRPGPLRQYGFPEEARMAFSRKYKETPHWHVVSLQLLRASTFQAVAVEVLLKNIHDRLRGTEHYEALLPAIEDVADLTSLQCNRAAVSAHAVCSDTRRAVLDAVDLPRGLRQRYLDAPFSTTLFKFPARGGPGCGGAWLPRRQCPLPSTSRQDDDVARYGELRGRRRSRSRSPPTSYDGIGEDDERRDSRRSRSRSRSSLRRRRRSSRSDSRESRVWNSSPKRRRMSSGSGPHRSAERCREDRELQGDRLDGNGEMIADRRRQRSGGRSRDSSASPKRRNFSGDGGRWRPSSLDRGAGNICQPDNQLTFGWGVETRKHFDSSDDDEESGSCSGDVSESSVRRALIKVMDNVAKRGGGGDDRNADPETRRPSRDEIGGGLVEP